MSQIRRCRFLKLFLSITALATSQLSFAGEDCLLNGESVSLYNGSTTAGKTGIIRCKDSETGKLSREREVKSGKIVGLYRLYREGIIALEYTDEENGQRHGVVREYANNGKLIKEENEVHGKRLGLQREWTSDGKPKSIEYIGDTESGSAKIRWATTGAINSLQCANKPVLAPHVDDASLCGFKGKPSTIHYFHDGGQRRASEVILAGVTQQAIQYDYNTGKERGSSVRKDNRMTEISYGDNGNKRIEAIYDLNVKPRALMQHREFHESGTLIKEQLFKQIELDGRRRNLLAQESRFYLNGQVRSQEKYRVENNVQFLELTNYADTGKMTSIATYLMENAYRNRPIGKHQSFHENGALATEDQYNADGKLFRQQQWNPQGVLIIDDAVFEDGSRKAFSK